jgi:hypothetical protein
LGRLWGEATNVRCQQSTRAHARDGDRHTRRSAHIMVRDHHAGDRDSPSIQEMSWPRPTRAPPNKAITRAGSLIGAAGEGLPCQAKVRQPSAAALRAAVPGPRLVHTPSEPSGSQRSPAVSSGGSFAQVAGAILREQARGQNPDKDEVQALPALGSTCGRWGPYPTVLGRPAPDAGHTTPLARCRGRRIPCWIST